MAVYDIKLRSGFGHRLNTLASIYTAECAAIYAALEYIGEQSYNNWIVITDSMSVLKALQYPKCNVTTNFIIYNIRDKYQCLSLTKDIVLFWTPSHIGVEGNEQADYLAKSIVNSNQIHTALNIPIPHTDALSHFKRTFLQDFQNYWQQVVQTKGKWLADIKNEISPPWFVKKKKYLHRKFYTTICRLRLGHSRSGAHLFRIGVLDSPTCQFCNLSIQTLDHIFFDCPQYNLQRFTLIDCLLNIYKNAEDIPRSLQQLLKTYDCFVPLYKFIVSTVGEI